ncbi:hypothetical protein BH23BAC3_BH23BAC3_11070 [soil metagenome]
MKTFLLTAILIFTFSGIIYSQSHDRVPIGNEEKFASGGNIAWINFARDIGPGETRLDLFREMFEEVNQNGGNMMRIWLHTNGTSTPEFDGMDVVGPGAGAISDLRDILDAAYFYDVSLMLCLWSFDMLQAGQMNDQQLQRNRGLLTDNDRLQTYIDNSLIPMVDSLHGHPAIASWEIFNEPEGMSSQFGWTPSRVDMSDIQNFINRTAGAIKRTAPDAFVTNGSWNIRASSDIGNFTNYYRDDRLIAAGTDEDGVLDYYTVHYYKHFPQSQSPFHNDASHWELDKPIIIAEFYLSDPRQDGDPDNIYGVHWSDLYETLYDRGYSGALGWQWFDWWAERTDMSGVDGTLSWPRMLENMSTMKDLYPDDVLISFEGIRLNFNAFPEGIEQGGNSTLSWEVRGAETVTLNGESVDPIDSMEVSPEETTTYTLVAIDEHGESEEKSVTITVLDPEAVNRAFQKLTTASSIENQQHLAEFATDGNMGTRWSSLYQDDEWLQVDLEKSFDIHNIKLYWEVAHAAVYTIDVSFDGFNWETIFEENNGDGGLDSLFFEQPEPARFVRMNGIERATEWGFSLFEFEVYGLESDQQPPQISILSPAADDYIEAGIPTKIAVNLQPGTEEGLSVSYYVNDELLETISEDPFSTTWTPTEDGVYKLYAIAGNNQFEIHSETVELTVYPKAEFILLEAENSTLSGDTEILTHGDASGGEFVRLEASGSLTWSDIDVNESGNYHISIGFRLPYESPKSQFLIINDNEPEEIEFSGEVNVWLTKHLNVDLESGLNTIRIEDSWGYMDFDYIEIRGQNLLTSSQSGTELAVEYKLGQNYPNPFNPSTIIPFSIATTSHVQVDVFDMAGRKISRLIDNQLAAGNHEVRFDAGSYSSGVYFYRIQAGNFIQSKRMVLIK